MTPRAAESGSSVIETVVATALLLIVLGGVASMGIVAMTTTENQGHLSARATEYAQDKMEQLLTLAYGDSVSNTVAFPTALGGGSGLTVGGSSSTAAPIDNYVDWLASDGSLLGGGAAAPASWFYERVWQVTCASAAYVPPQACADNPPTGVKQIFVTVTVRSSIGGFMLPRSTVMALKSAQF
jgi:hypothetical protein